MDKTIELQQAQRVVNEQVGAKIAALKLKQMELDTLGDQNAEELAAHMRMEKLANAHYLKIAQGKATEVLEYSTLQRKAYGNGRLAMLVGIIFASLVLVIGVALSGMTGKEADAEPRETETTETTETSYIETPSAEEPVVEVADARPDWTLLRDEVICNGDDYARYPIRQFSLQGKQMNWTCIPRYVRDELENAAVEYGINVNMLAGLINTESAFNPNAVSYAGAEGCGQFMPATWEGMQRQGRIPMEWQRTNCEEAIQATARKLHDDGWSDTGWRGALTAYLGSNAAFYQERVSFWGAKYQSEEV